MLRVILVQIFLFLLPFIGFGIYMWVTRGLAVAQDSYQGKRLLWLVLAGSAVALAGFVALATLGGEQTGVYVPLEYRDGQLVPGGFRDQ